MDTLPRLLEQIHPPVMRWIYDALGYGQSGNVVGEGPGVDLLGRQVGLGGDSILLYDAAGAPVGEFAFTSAGFDLALAAAASGDAIYLPAGVLAGDHVLVAGVHVVGLARFATILTGQITGADGASLENCSVARTANDANALYGVVGQSSGTFYIHACHIVAAQAGAGNAAALYVTAGGTVEVWLCSLRAPSGGAGWHYGVYCLDGSVYVEGGVCVGASGASNI